MTHEAQVEVVLQLVYRAMITAAARDRTPDWLPYGDALMRDTARASAKEIIEEIGQAPPTIPTVEMVVAVLASWRGYAFPRKEGELEWAEQYVRNLSHPRITVGVTTFWYAPSTDTPWACRLRKNSTLTHSYATAYAVLVMCGNSGIELTDDDCRAILALKPSVTP